MTFPNPPTSEDLEHYRGYLKLIAQMQLGMRLRAKEDASDVVQRVMLAACQDINTFRGKSEAELRAWLSTMMSNVIAGLGRHYSRRRREVEREVSLAMSLEESSILLQRNLIGKEAEPSDGLIAKEEFDQLVACLLQLLEDERTAIVLKYLHSRTIAEIAEHIGRSEAAVGGLLRRGLEKLRNRTQK